MTAMNEDTLVQQTTADYLRDVLGWDIVYAFNTETFGPDGTLGRASEREVLLKRHLRRSLEKLNPGLPEDAYQAAIREIEGYSASQSTLAVNREKYRLLKKGVKVAFRDAEGARKKDTLRVFDFKEPTNNHFLAVRELRVSSSMHNRRPDIVGFVNGIPLLFVELKNVDKDPRVAFDANLSDYKDTIPHLFHYNALMLLGNGETALIGSLTSRYEHFHDWKRLEEDEPGVVDMETLLKGVCNKRDFMDIFENFILFDDSGEHLAKIVGRNHQFLGVNRAVRAVEERKSRGGKLGVFWHTQGAGKSYSMVFFTEKVHRKLGNNFTFLICTDRVDLDKQIYDTFAGCGVVGEKARCRAGDEQELREMMGQHKGHVFTLIHKFNKKIDPSDKDAQPYTMRDDVIVISDEAHRTQYGMLALNMRDALPNASYIGFTGTPLFKEDELTRRVFGDYVSTYDFQRAVDDNATVPLYYDARGDKLGVKTDFLNEMVAEKLDELGVDQEDFNFQERLEKELRRDYHIITAKVRLNQIARDFVDHYSESWGAGKAMLVCIDKITCVRMYDLIRQYWEAAIVQLETGLDAALDEQAETQQRRKIEWMRKTVMAVIVSDEQGEVEKFQEWNLEITPHRQLIRNGFDVAGRRKRQPVDKAFKEADHPFRVAIVCAMWMTGFDVPCLSTLYLDKPLKAHTLMQAIARANRVYEGKNNGLIVDYCGILKNLRKALATFAGVGPGGEPGTTDPTKPQEDLLEELAEAIDLVRSFLGERQVPLDAVIESTSFARIKAISAAKEAVNGNDETRKRFEVMSREVFRKFRACLNAEGVQGYRDAYEAINIIYKKLQADREAVDISDVMRVLHGVVDEAIGTAPERDQGEREPYDISKVDFELLRREFTRSPSKNTAVQMLKNVVETRLRRMLERNPLRVNFQIHFEAIVDEYNREKDQLVIQRTFEALVKMNEELDEEERRAIKEGLDGDESLAIFDILMKGKPDLSASDIARIKRVAVELLAKLKKEKLGIDHWRDKESTRAGVKVEIRDFLWSDDTGLPVDSYTEADVEAKTDDIFVHVLERYPSLPSPFYMEAAGT